VRTDGEHPVTARSVDGKPFVIVGDTFLDEDVSGRAERVCADAPALVVDDARRRARPGGAGLAAVLAARSGRRVVLVTALTRPEDEPADLAGAELRSLLARAGVAVVALDRRAPTPVKERVLVDGRSVLRVDHGGRGPDALGPVGGPRRAALEAAVASAGAIVVSDYGRGVAAHPDVRAVLERTVRRAPVVWDPHPRGPRPVAVTRVATPNLGEAAQAIGEAVADGAPWRWCTRIAEAARRHWAVPAIALTLGDRGALLATGDGTPLVVPAVAVVGDPCGAGDAFAVALAGALVDGAVLSEALAWAVTAATAHVAGGGAGAWRVGDLADRGAAGALGAAVGLAPAVALAERVRLRGGTIVATGGCFDLLHAGHVATLEAARAMGDSLVVLVNSDASVRALKGPSRPLVPEADRVRVLAALGCVDAVVVFDEPTPLAVLDRLRPHVFAKGGDYRAADLPEARVLTSWEGQVVVVPYLSGRSTSGLVTRAREQQAARR
jgi:rfaE bifunctional protein nucleotidyltransferase chain/domain